MNEEKTLKHWLKRKASFSQALLVVFLMTGGVAFGGVEEDLKALQSEVNKLKEAQLHYIGINSSSTETGTNFDNKGAKGEDAIVIGPRSKSERMADRAIVIGSDSKTGLLASDAIVIGSGATGDGATSVIIGSKAFGGNINGIAIGHDAKSMGTTGSTAIGYYAKSEKAASLAIGASAHALEYHSVALGADSKASDEMSVAIGDSAKSLVKGGVALGGYSKAGRPEITSSTVAPFSNITFGIGDKEVRTKGALSVGATHFLRQIINVGDGTEATDAVNLRQLEGAAARYFSVKSTLKTESSNYLNNGAKDSGGIAIGEFANTTGIYSTAMGKGATSLGAGSVSVGYGAFSYAKAKEEAIKAKSDGLSLDEFKALTDEEKKNYFRYYRPWGALYYKATTALGRNVTVGQNAGSFGENNVSIGNASEVEGRSNIALGDYSRSKGEGSAAMGYEATTAGNGSISLGRGASSAGEGLITIGRFAFSTDAAENTKESILPDDYNKKSGEEKSQYVPMYDDQGTPIKYYKSEKLNTSTSSIAIGNAAKSFGRNNVVLGTNAKVAGIEEIEKGEIRGGTALGFGTNVSAWNGVALGSGSIADRAELKSGTVAPFSNVTFGIGEKEVKTSGAVSVGREGKLRQIINVGDATQATDAVNLRQLSAVDAKITTLSGNVTNMIDVTNGSGIKVTSNTDSGGRKTFTVALDKDTKDKIDIIGTGAIAKGNVGTVTGGTVFDYVKDQIGTATGNTMISYKADGETTSNKVTALEGFHFKGDDNIKITSADKGVLNYTLNSNLSGIESISNGKTTIALEDNTVNFGGAKLTNLAEGEVSATSTDAVTGARLYKTENKIDMLEKNSSNQMEAINKNAEQIQNVKNEVGHVGSLSAALAALHPMQYDPVRPNQVMAGLGHYRDKQAVAVGVSHHFNENFMMTAGVSVGNESKARTMANVGFTWKLGKDEDIEKVPERYQEGPISSIYVMQQEMEAILQENRSQKAQLQAQQSKIDEMAKQLEMLLKK